MLTPAKSVRCEMTFWNVKYSLSPSQSTAAR